MNEEYEKLVSSAYSKSDVDIMTIEELKVILLTTDGKGKEFKAKALNELIERIKDETRDYYMDKIDPIPTGPD